jgi:hypothetical protein
VKAAIAQLRADGLVDVERGVDIRVREPVEKESARVPRGATVAGRMPTAEERSELDIPEGVPVMVVSYGGRERVYPCDRVVLTFA